MELNSFTVLRNGNQSLPGSYSTNDVLPKFIFVSLIALVSILIGTIKRKDIITGLAGLVFATPKSSKGIPSVSTWIIFKSFLLYGTGTT